ncbi:transposase [Patescibacteria group bacterium]|nr:transposase [Patescibacteria group bacterium]MBU1890440.1 transposase [Patescibacteria group bacterium]
MSNSAIYFLTGTTYIHYPYFREENQKQIILNRIDGLRNKFEMDYIVFSISMNHYHLKFRLNSNNLIPKIRQFLHGGTSYDYRKLFPKPYEHFWQSFHSRRIDSEVINWKISRYIIGNPLKHREVSRFDDLLNYPFCSFYDFSKKHGIDQAKTLVRSVIQSNEDADGYITICKL